MASKRTTFYQRDLARAIRGLKAAGFEPGPIEIGPDGRIVIMPKMLSEPIGADPVEQWESKYRARKA